MTVDINPRQATSQNLSPTELTRQSLTDSVDFKALSPVADPEVSGPQGSIRPFTTVQDPSAWKAADWKKNQDWVYRLTPADIAELDSAVASAVGQGIRKEGNYLFIKETVATKAVFALPNLGPRLEAIRENVRVGRGFQLIKGVPVDRYSREETMVAYWGIGLYLGRANAQNRKGHLIGHIKDINGNPHDPITRIYTTSIAQPFHCDVSDIVGLLCLKQAKRGGLSSFTSSISIVNEMVRLGRRDLVEELAGPEWWLDRKGEVPQGMQAYFCLPIVHYYNGLLGVQYSATYYHLAQRHPQVPRLTEKQEEALQFFNALARSDELRMDMDLQPGDIQLLYNHTMLHSRSAFDDHDNWADRRHLLRLWVSPAQDRALPEIYSSLWGNIEPGNRGGLKGFGAEPTIPLEAE